ncbi:MAG: beta-propeller domain-containing protein [Roseburia sp.]|nr:beta-propeller domain-containing protein [Roseburia sp.]
MNDEKLKQMSEQIPIPENLKPEHMEKRLVEHKRNQKNLLVKRMANRIALTAACFLLLLLAGNYFLSSEKLSFFGGQTDEANSTTPPALTTGQQNPAFTYEDMRTKIAACLTDMNSLSSGDDILYKSKDTNKMLEGLAEAEDAYSTGSSSDGLSGSGAEYSDTDLQVEGVDEGDLVKTDGKFIYVCSDSAFGSSIQIYEADGKNTKRVCHLSVDSVEVSEMYLHDDTLALVGTNLEMVMTEDGSQTETSVLLYNVSDVSNPVLYFQKTQSGNYSNSRMNGKYLYTISTMYVMSADSSDAKQRYIPSVGGQLVPEEDLYCPTDVSANSYLVFTALDVTEGEDFSDTLSVLGADDTCYASENNIYIAAPSSNYLSYGKTTISKYHYGDGKLDAACETTFQGTILNQFSLDEYKGNLRFVATTYSTRGSSSNGLYVLDENLKLIGSVDKLAKSESIYSARFLGDTAYFVTYRQTDPVFMVDLTDPSNPVVKDKLKLPGFSTYLHPFGDNLLLGIGSNETSDGDSQVKLSMFDISSASSVKEKHTKLLSKGTMSIAGMNHKAILVSAEQNLIGFCTIKYDYDTGDETTKYQIYSYDSKKGFEKIAALSPNGLNIDSARGLYIGDYLYLADGDGLSGIQVYDRETMKMVGKAE